MERILIEIADGSVINVMSTTKNIQLEFLDHDFEYPEHNIQEGPDDIRTPQEIDIYIDAVIEEERKKHEGS